MADKLDKVFLKQQEFMSMLREHDRLPEYPVDLTTKPGQRIVKETAFNMLEELMEASFTLKNRMHRLTDAKELDFDHFREEIGDTFAYFIEVCILCGISSQDLYDEYSRKNQIVKERLSKGY